LGIWLNNVVGTNNASYSSDIPGASLTFLALDSDATSKAVVSVSGMGIFDEPLTSADRTELYNSGLGSPASFASLSPLLFIPANPTEASGKDLTLKASSTNATSVTVSGGGGHFADNDPLTVYDKGGFGVWGLANGTPTGANIPVDDGEGGNVADLDNVGVGCLFDGSSYLDGGDIHDVTTGNLVVSILFKTTSTASQNTATSKRNGSGNGWQMYTQADGTVVFEADDGTTVQSIVSSAIVNNGQWHVATMAYIRSTTTWTRLFINGVVDDSTAAAATGDLSNSDNFRIGAESDPSASGKFDGVIRDVKVWTNVTLASVNDIIQAGWDLAAQPLEDVQINGQSADGWYKLIDDDFDTQADDSSGNANHLTTIVGSPARVQDSDLIISRNLFIDPGAERQAIGSWLRRNGNVTLSKDLTTVDKDSRAFKATTTVSTGLAKTFKVPKGSTVKIALRYHHDNVSATFAFTVYDVTAATALDGDMTPIKDGAWHRHEWVVEIDNTGAFLHEIELRAIRSGSGSATLYLDDLRVELSYITDGDCEGITGWSQLGTPSTFATELTEWHSAGGAIEIGTATDGEGASHATDNLETFQYYEAGIHTKADTGTTPAQLRLRMVNFSSVGPGDVDRNFAQTDSGEQYNGYSRRALIFRTDTDVMGDINISKFS
ncbi:MAG: LamG domain-containing protein, partial [Saprospiraceae bacterium]|nr:LamG domain-containing protein [Saprospiraceae bacterium]